ncbi:signal peptidase I [Campylobacter sp. MIT 97-5078]|uniref:signal peptidase I n=1 Tax=Campylobacter sp. MIT 97-5078 TaxID=1548153 RepID=UPI000512E04F|nr:signal peptidase I [Campylobacter sp. MIT 97-5078]KGI57002.1 signal peptidase [Campylobacter sp. MIT 97-5078]TQR28167.1 signal peptidase I [Campylobacter sp. MIT 97-5078]
MQKLKSIHKFSQSWIGTIIIVLLVIFFFIQAFTIPSGSMKNTLLVGDFLFVKKFSYGLPIPHIPWVEVPILPDFNGDGHLLRGKEPQRGDIVVFRNPLDPKIHFVKRLVAKGGDEVVMVGSTLYVKMSEGDEYMKQNYADSIVYIQNQIFVKEPYKQKGIHTDERVDMEATYNLYLSRNAFAMQPIILSGFGEVGANGANAYYYAVPQDEYFMMGDNRDHSNDSRFWGSVPYKFIVGTPWFTYFSWDENKNIRWERIGRFIDTLENDERYIHHKESKIGALE